MVSFYRLQVMLFHTFIQQVADSVVHPSGDYVLLQTSIRQFYGTQDIIFPFLSSRAK